jgi:cell shape-determining protein MreC
MNVTLWRKALLFFAVGAVLVSGGLFMAPRATGSLRQAVLPVMEVAGNIQRIITGAWGIIAHSARRTEEIRRLRIAESALTARIALMEDIERENQDLRRALGREPSHLQFIFARIVGYSPSRLDDYLVVDAGFLEGVSAGMSVLAGEAVHIGSIAETAEHSSVVKLVSHAGEKVEVHIPETGVSSIAEGQGAGALSIQVPASLAVKEGEPILRAGPPDFLLGYVEKIEKSDAGPFQIIRTSHPLSLRDLRRVFIMRNITENE